MRHARFFPAALLFATLIAVPLLHWGTAFSQDKDKSVAAKEKLQGIWSVTELMEAGKKAPDAKAQSLRIEFKGEAITINIKDKAAVSAAITTSWSNGQTEGQITKLKLVKRQMYGRAKLDLLQARLIGAT